MASANPDKVAEIAAILGDAVELAPRPAGLADVVEDGDTLEDNARLKAVAVCEAAGVGAVADDTGLEVDALGGAPGRATRPASPARTPPTPTTWPRCWPTWPVVPEEERGARFRTVALVHFPDGTEVVAEGVVEGRIASEARGDRGFGYDPLFIPADGDGRTFAEMSADEKHAVSHRGRAFRALAPLLEARSGA